MKKTIIIFIFFFLSALFLFTQPVCAEEKKSGISATFTSNILIQKTDNQKDIRVEVLTKYLEDMNSPLTPYAKDFVIYADEYNLPWNLVAGISGTESTFGKAVPYNCNNAWGFGIYGNHVTCFASYSEAIQTISKALRENYMDKWKAQTVGEIGSIYAASPTWAAHTSSFMESIEKVKSDYENRSLLISI